MMPLCMMYECIMYISVMYKFMMQQIYHQPQADIYVYICLWSWILDLVTHAYDAYIDGSWSRFKWVGQLLSGEGLTLRADFIGKGSKKSISLFLWILSDIQIVSEYNPNQCNVCKTNSFPESQMFKWEGKEGLEKNHHQLDWFDN